MTTVRSAKEKEPVFFILSDANTYFRVELVDDRLIVTCDNFAWGPQRVSVQSAGRNELELDPVVTRHDTYPSVGFIRREIGPQDAARGGRNDGKPSAEMIEVLRGIRTEIGAGMVMFPKSPAEIAHNNACERANSIIADYIEGYGLLQMTKAAIGGSLAVETPPSALPVQESGTNKARSAGRARSKKKAL